MSITINNQTFENNKMGYFNPPKYVVENEIRYIHPSETIRLSHFDKSGYLASIADVAKDASPMNKRKHHIKHLNNAAYYILTKVKSKTLKYTQKSLLDVIIIHDNPSDCDAASKEYKSSSTYDPKKDKVPPAGFITRIALDNDIKVFRKINDFKYIEYTGYKPIFEEHSGKYYLSYYKYFTNEPDLSIEQQIVQDNNIQYLTQAEKDSLSFELKYYDLDYPRSEAEWSLVKETIEFYKKNNIPYAFDTNQFYICPDCKHLARIDTPHECFNEMHEYNKLDYIVNGGE